MINTSRVLSGVILLDKDSPDGGSAGGSLPAAPANDQGGDRDVRREVFFLNGALSESYAGELVKGAQDELIVVVRHLDGLRETLRKLGPGPLEKFGEASDKLHELAFELSRRAKSADVELGKLLAEDPSLASFLAHLSQAVEKAEEGTTRGRDAGALLAAGIRAEDLTETAVAARESLKEQVIAIIRRRCAPLGQFQAGEHMAGIVNRWFDKYSAQVSKQVSLLDDLHKRYPSTADSSQSVTDSGKLFGEGAVGDFCRYFSNNCENEVRCKGLRAGSKRSGIVNHVVSACQSDIPGEDWFCFANELKGRVGASFAALDYENMWSNNKDREEDFWMAAGRYELRFREPDPVARGFFDAFCQGFVESVNKGMGEGALSLTGLQSLMPKEDAPPSVKQSRLLRRLSKMQPFDLRELIADERGQNETARGSSVSEPTNLKVEPGEEE